MHMLLRKTDLFAIIGLVMLLVWTPSYYAQDPVEQALTGGTTFTLPTPRDGDRAVLEFQIREDGGEVQAFGPVMEVRFERTGAEDGPGAHYTMTFEHLPIAFETNHTTYDQPGHRTIVGFNGHGQVEWVNTQRWKEINEEGEEERWGQTFRMSPPLRCPYHALNGLHGDRFTYAPSTSEALLQELRLKYLEERGDEVGGCMIWWEEGIDGSTVNVAAQMADHTLYGRHELRSDRLLDRLASTGSFETCTFDEEGPLLTRTPDTVYWGGKMHVDLGPVQIPLQAREGFTYSCDLRAPDENWQWYTPAFPYMVGLHRAFLDGNGSPLLEIDLAPVVLERGEGDPLPVDTRRTEAEPPVPAVAAGPQLEKILLKDLEKDPRPLAHGITLQEVRSAVEQEASPDQRLFLEDASLVRFRWTALGPEPVPSRSLSPFPTAMPELPWDEASDETSNTSNLDVVYQKHDGVILSCQVTFHVDELQESKRSRLRSCREYAKEQYHGGDRHFDWDAKRVSPWAIVEALAARHPDRFPFLAPEARSWSILDWDAHDSAIRATYVWRDDDRSYAVLHNMSTGSIRIEEGRFETSDDPPSGRPITASSATATPVRLDPLTTTAAFTGLFLVLVSLVARLWGGIKSGTIAAGAAGLYAKIRKDALLEHERRDAILALVREDPGVTLQELQRRLGYGWGSTVHHVETLCRNGLIQDLRVHRLRHLFAAEHAPDERRRLVAVRDPQLASLLEAIREQPGLPLKELATTCTRSVSAASRAGSRLDALGVVEKRKEGRSVRFYPRS